MPFRIVFGCQSQAQVGIDYSAHPSVIQTAVFGKGRSKYLEWAIRQQFPQLVACGIAGFLAVTEQLGYGNHVGARNSPCHRYDIAVCISHGDKLARIIAVVIHDVQKVAVRMQYGALPLTFHALECFEYFVGIYVVDWCVGTFGRELMQRCEPLRIGVEYR